VSFFRRQRRDADMIRLRAFQDAMARRALANAAAEVEQPRPAPWTPPSREDPIDLTCDPCGAGPLKPADSKSREQS
jgi:hypothetical protein